MEQRLGFVLFNATNEQCELHKKELEGMFRALTRIQLRYHFMLFLQRNKKTISFAVDNGVETASIEGYENWLYLNKGKQVNSFIKQMKVFYGKVSEALQDVESRIINVDEQVANNMMGDRGTSTLAEKIDEK
eukprot:g7278.t1